MAHPSGAPRAHVNEKSRVAHIVGSGAGGHSDAAQDRKLVRGMVKPAALKVEGAKPKARADRFARGGKVKGGGKTTVNVIVPQGHQQAGLAGPGPMPPPAAMAPRPPMAPPMAGPPGAMPPPGAPPGLPPGLRSTGGRAYKAGGRVTDGPAWKEGLRNGTQVQHDPGNSDRKNMGRGKPITYKAGGRISSPEKGAMGPKFDGGAGGGKARQEKAARAKTHYAKA